VVFPVKIILDISTSPIGCGSNASTLMPPVHHASVSLCFKILNSNINKPLEYDHIKKIGHFDFVLIDNISL
jgi:hypothetical protein